MKNVLMWITLIAAAVVLNLSVNAQHHDQQHHEGVNKRGDHAIGFSHARTTHHFRLKKDGGIIEVTANDASDTASRDQIRAHLQHIAKKFSAGDFAAPMFIHAQTPPGVHAMKRLKAEIEYVFEEIERGGQVRISTGNPDAIKAIHEFLRFQINDHQTGDSTDVEKSVRQP
jgi:hypothetical protein